MHLIERDDGLQVLGLDYCVLTCLFFSFRSRSRFLISFVDLQREDLEFSVGSKAAVWEVKDPLLVPGQQVDFEDDSASTYHVAPASLIGGIGGNHLYGNAPVKTGYMAGYPGNGRGGGYGPPSGVWYGGRGYPPSS